MDDKRSVVVAGNEIFAGDKGSLTYTFTMDKDAFGLDLSTLTPYLNIEFSDKTTDKLSLTKTVSGDKIVLSIVVGSNMSRVEGDAKCQITFENTSSTIIFNSQVFIITINESVNGELNPVIAGTSVVRLYQQQLLEAQEELSDELDSGDFVVGELTPKSTQIHINGGSKKVAISGSDIENTCTNFKVDTDSGDVDIDDLDYDGEDVDICASDIDITAEDSFHLNADQGMTLECQNTGNITIEANDGHITMQSDTGNIYLSAYDKVYIKNRDVLGNIDSKVDKVTTANKVEVYAHNGNTQSTIELDSEPTSDSDNLVKSGGIKSKIDSTKQELQNSISSLNSTLTTTINNKVSELEKKSVVSTLYEGVDLTVKFSSEIANFSSPWAWIKNRITNGNFEGIFVGDYIPMTFDNMPYKMQVAGINTYKGTLNTPIGNHIDFISKEVINQTICSTSGNNNGTEYDAFIGDGVTNTFQMLHRTNNSYPSAITKVKVNGVDTQDYTYDSETGVLTLTNIPAQNAIIKGCFNGRIAENGYSANSFCAGRLYAYLNSQKMGIKSPSSANGECVEVNYSAGGVYYKLPQEVKNVITPKRVYSAMKSSLTATLNNDESTAGYELSYGNLWLPTEVELFGYAILNKGIYSQSYFKQYPLFINNAPSKTMSTYNVKFNYWINAYCDSNQQGYITKYGELGVSPTNNNLSPIICFRVGG